MRQIFTVSQFEFPYADLKFPGQATDEQILYVTREAPVMLHLRLFTVGLVSLVLATTGSLVPFLMPSFSPGYTFGLIVGSFVLGIATLGIGSWWMTKLWKKSIFILTNRRLTKFIYTTPWNRYDLSLGLDKIVDTGAYARGYFQAVFGIGTFSARSSAGNRADKYFYIENVHRSEDLKHYISKLLHHYNHNENDLKNFRPFIPWLKGEARKRFLKNYPQYWS